MTEIEEKKKAVKSDRRPEAFGQYDNPSDVETYVSFSRKSITGWIERGFVRTLLRRFGHLSNLNVLDVATGPAWIPLALAEIKPEWNFTAIDASRLMLEKARAASATLGVKINFIEARAECTTLPSEKFDLIISHFALHEFPDPVAALLEMQRLLKPGGRIVIQDLHRPAALLRNVFVFFATLANRSIAMGKQYKESLRASYRVGEAKRMLARTELVFTVSLKQKMIGGLIQIWATKPAIASENTPTTEKNPAELIIEAARMAPSGDNCQPWKFAWDSKRIFIHFESERAAAFLDTKESASWIALGAVLTNMHIAAQEIGFSLGLELFPHDAENTLVARVDFFPIEKTPHPLFHCIQTRCTNRKPYTTEKLTSADRSDLMGIANSIPGVSLHLIEDKPEKKRLAKLLAPFDRQFFRIKAIHDCFHHWIRWSHTEILETQDGLPVGSLELNFLDRLALKLASSWSVARTMAGLGLDRIAELRARSLYRHSAAMGVLTVSGNQPKDLVMGGMVFQRIWLTAANKGYALQPITGMLFLDLKLRNNDAEGFDWIAKENVFKTRRSMGTWVPEYATHTPVMMFRMGRAEKPSARAPRKPVDQLLKLNQNRLEVSGSAPSA